ncbi:MAG: ABC transporter permease [Spirochaetia bacterium]|jgi:macrolide transport system ATP-binding/permease protein
MGRPLIVTENLTKTYDTGTVEVRALKGVSVTLEGGEFVAVMGPSGSGKSTFLNLLGCLDHPSSGTYVLDGTDVSTMSDDQLAAVRSKSIGFVFQGFNLLARTSAEHNIELPLIYTGERRRSTPAHALLEAVGMPQRGKHNPNELSGGEQQRVAIARALVNSPAIILADEPTGNLDSRMSDEIMDIFLSLNRAGITILMVTHEESVAAYAKRLIKFKDGTIVADEPMPSPKPINGTGIDVDKIRQVTARATKKRRGILTPGELWENVRSAARSLLQNKMRAVLTILGILIGVGAVIAMVSVGQGATAGVTQRIQGLGSNFLTVTPGSANVGGVRQGFGSVSTLTIDDAAAIKANVTNIVGVEPENNARQQLKYQKNNWQTSLTGTSADYPFVRNWNTSSGAFFTDEDNRAKRSVVVLGQDVVTNLFGEDEDAVGKSVKIGSANFKVVGVLEKKGAGGGFFSQDDTALIPINTMYARFRRQKDVRSIGVTATDKDHLDQVKADITALLEQRHKIQDGAADDFSIITQQDVLQTVQGVSQIMTLLLGAIGGISLLVGGIGIMNIMLVSVTERTREIGIRKALGARRRDIMAQFLIEAIILSGLGGLLGWGLGALASQLISRFGGVTAILTMGTVGLALGFSIAVGLFFGIYPARKASRMDPIQALHFE